MHKVMTRAQQRTSTRPPTRGDSRRPSGTPPRTPGGPRRRPAPADDGPPQSPGTARATVTGPADNRPGSPRARRAAASRATAPAPAPGAPDSAPDTPRPAHAPGSPVGTRPGTGPARPLPVLLLPGHRPGAAPSAAPPADRQAPTVPAQTRRRITVPQPSPTDLFADRLLAVLSGRRPVHWMLRHTAGRAYDELALLAERAPLRTRGPLPVVHDIGYYVPRPGAIEAFARIGAGDRLRALAFRLEQGADLRWRCTAVETGGPRHATA
ncbi:Rv3235 family protein [Streptomyces sp. ACT015]|uniref:Rv3235 family protein n=1 Tax=Streptomyces sp. ACT015 TaxID=3134807 RepID=UPI003D17DB34